MCLFICLVCQKDILVLGTQILQLLILAILHPYERRHKDLADADLC